MRYGRLLTVTVDGETRRATGPPPRRSPRRCPRWASAPTRPSCRSSRSQTLGRAGPRPRRDHPQAVSVKVDGTHPHARSTAPTVKAVLRRAQGHRRRRRPGPPGADRPRVGDRPDDHRRPREAEDGQRSPRPSRSPAGHARTATSTRASRTVTAGHAGARVVSYLEPGSTASARAARSPRRDVTAEPVARVDGGRHQGPPDRSPRRPTAAALAGNAVRRRHQPRRRQRRVGPDRPVRVRRQLAHQHRQRLLRRPAVRPRPPGRPPAAATTPRAPTSPPASSRSPSPTACYAPGPASARGAARTRPDRLATYAPARPPTRLRSGAAVASA